MKDGETMRLIDADDLLKRTEHYDTFDEYKVLNPHVKRIDIETQPTIDAIPARHGRWIKMSDADGVYYNCLLCGDSLPRYSLCKPTWQKPFPQRYSIDKTDFCPNCGAMMGEQVDDSKTENTTNKCDHEWLYCTTMDGYGNYIYRVKCAKCGFQTVE